MGTDETDVIGIATIVDEYAESCLGFSVLGS